MELRVEIIATALLLFCAGFVHVKGKNIQNFCITAFDADIHTTPNYKSTPIVLQIFLISTGLSSNLYEYD